MRGVCKRMGLHGRFEYGIRCMVFHEFVVIKRLFCVITLIISVKYHQDLISALFKLTTCVGDMLCFNKYVVFIKYIFYFFN